MSCKTKKGYAFNQKAIQRRVRVIERLENQLKTGTKMEKSSKLTKVTADLNQVSLTEKDIERIKKEIAILQSRI